MRIRHVSNFEICLLRVTISIIIITTTTTITIIINELVALELHQGLLQRGLSYFTPKKRYDIIIFADRAVKVTSLPHAQCYTFNQ
jgi:hypothetical protein